MNRSYQHAIHGCHWWVWVWNDSLGHLFCCFFFFGGVVNIVDICGFVVRLVVLAWEENGSKRTSEKKPADTCGVY